MTLFAVVAALLLSGCGGAGHSTSVVARRDNHAPTPAVKIVSAVSQLVPAVPATFTLGPGLTVRELGRDVWEVTHVLPWPANSLLVKFNDGTLVLVGTPYTPEATRLVLAWARKNFHAPQFLAINTGYHVDNLGGNAALREAAIPIWGSDLTVALLAERGELTRRWTLAMIGEGQSVVAGAHAQVPYLPPDHLFPASDGQGLVVGSEPIELIYPGPSQAPDKLAVYFPWRKVLFGSCMVLGGDRAGNLAEADLEGWRRAIGVLQTRPADVVVPGHGERTDPGLLALTLEVLYKLDPEAIAAQRRRAGMPEPHDCPLDMVTLPAGTLTLGSNEGDNAAAARVVALGSFCLDRTEVTVRAYADCVKAHACTAVATTMGPDFTAQQRAAFDPLLNGQRRDRGQHPANGVTWEQARSYCSWRDRRLPSETEWEYAARDAGQRDASYAWDPTDRKLRTRNGCGRECVRLLARHGIGGATAAYPWDDAYEGTAPVGSFADGATAQGLMDMEGNVAEWTASVFPRLFSGLNNEPYRILRGSSWSAFLAPKPNERVGEPIDWLIPDIGFRCAADRF